MRVLALVMIILVLASALIWFAVEASANFSLIDFTFTFYRAANYFLRGENPYLADYVFPADGTQHPPYNPSWILYAAVPFSVFPIRVAQAIRFLVEITSIPLLAYFSARWAGVSSVWRIALLALAPWFSIALYSGQWASLALVGCLVCYWGVRRADPWRMSIGIWLSAARPNFVLLVVLATFIYAWRSRTLYRTLVILAGLVAIFSIQFPTWIIDLLNLYVDRFVHPRPMDSVLLLPFWPYAQFAGMALGVVFAFWGARKYSEPTLWFWSVLVTLGLVSSLHSYTYDWIILMLPLAWILRERAAMVLVVLLYLYPFLWASWSALGAPIILPSPAILPSVILISSVLWNAFSRSGENERALP